MHFSLYLHHLPPRNTALPSSLCQKDGDPPLHTVGQQNSQKQKAWVMALQEQSIICNILPRTQHAHWLSCNAQQGQTLQRWPLPGTPRLSSSVVPPAHDPHRYVHRKWPSKLGTWWVFAEPVSYLALRKRRWILCDGKHSRMNRRTAFLLDDNFF